MVVEAALIKLGTVAVRTAAKLWLGDEKIAAEVSASAVDFMSERLVSHRDKRKFNRMLDSFAEEVATRVEPIIEREFRDLRENDRLATIEAVVDTFALASLTGSDLFDADLDAGHLDRSIRARVPSQTRLLSASSTALYDLLLRECCGYVIEIARGLPQFSVTALVELLQRDREILDAIREVLARLPQRDRTSGFDYDYRQLVARKLDQVQMYGVTLSDASRKYPLSVAYISLTAATEREDSVFEETRIEEQLARNDRVFIRGEAGLGKTTLLHWIAVRSALSDFRAPLLSWNGTVPFFLPLRRYSNGNLPAPEKFLNEIGSHIADEMPRGWVHSLLRSGRAALLIDGVDEVVAEQRDAVRAWLSDLVASFPQAKFVITSRPGAAPGEWLQDDDFAVVDLQPMTPRDVRIFIERWHEAMRSMTADTEAQAEITDYERSLTTHLDAKAHIRKLAGYPLLCALLCALHKDRRAALPSNRMELYDVALQMMLERRDAERKINDTAGLHRMEKMLLLGDLAYWLIRNGKSDTEIERAQDRFDRRLNSMPQVKADATQVYQHLLERSGLLREPVQGRVDFVHRTFQEYLAAEAAMKDEDDVGTVVENAHLDQWHEVVVMSVGSASRKQREELLSGLLMRSASDGEEHRDTLDLLALASLETAPELSSILREAIETRTRRLLPPKSLTVAKSFASAGPFVLDLLANTRPKTAKETVATIRAIAQTGLPEAIPLLAKYADDGRSSVMDELAKHWDLYDPEDYARLILRDSIVTKVTVVNNPAKLHSIRHLRAATSLAITSKASDQVDLTIFPKLLAELTLELEEGSDRETIGTTGTIDIALLKHNVGLGSLIIAAPALENFSTVTRLPILTDLTVRCRSIRPDPGEVAQQPILRTATIEGSENLTGINKLRSFTNIEHLTLRNNYTLQNLAGVEQWQHSMASLEIDSCPITDISALASLRQLESLTLSNTEVTEIGALSNLRNLEDLDLSSSPVTDVAPLAGLTGLKTLDLRGTRVTDISALRNLSGLRKLYIDLAQIGDRSPLAIDSELMELYEYGILAATNPFTREPPPIPPLDTGHLGA